MTFNCGGRIDFNTTYKKEFTKKNLNSLGRFDLTGKKSDDNCIVRGPYLQRISLNSKEENVSSVPTLCFERKVSLENAIKNIKQNYPSIAKKYFKNDINVDIIQQMYDNRKKSVYQADYTLKEINENEEKRFELKFDSNYKIPETVQQYSYQPPQSVAFTKIERVKPMRQDNDRSLQNEIDKILEVKCGNSVYMMGHSLLGRALIESKPFGEPYESPMCGHWGDPDNLYSLNIRH